MSNHRVGKGFAAATLAAALLLAGGVRAQETMQQGGGAGRGQFAGMQRVAGEVSGVSGAQITLKSEDGSTVQVVTTENTRLMKSGGNGGTPAPIKVADLKPGDGVMAMGNMDAPNKTLHAAMVIATDAAVVKSMRENMGKTYIAGRVTAIDADNLKMTVQRSDGVSQTIGFDETTSFKRGGRGGRMAFGMPGGGGAGAQRQGGGGANEGESITLADIKVGDTVAGQGALKGGTFVPAQLNVMTPRARRAEGAAGSAAAGATAAPKQ